ncbi:MAG: putative quinol monooxygenase [Bryobacteraceae bacterium]|jgi:quinol monooxygenase YgiN
MSLPTHLTVVAELSAKSGREEELKQLLLSIIDPVRREDGCIQYDLHVSTNEPANFVFYENWKDADALQRHATSRHMREFQAKAAELVAGPTRVSTYTRIA